MPCLRRPGCGLLAVVALVACATDRTPYVARVGQHRITVAEYQRRAEKLMRAGYRAPDTLDQAAKEKLLDAMVAQDLLVLEGLNRGLDRDTAIARQVQEAEVKATLSHVYDTQARRKEYTATEEELRRYHAEAGYDTEVLSQQIVCPTEAEARQALAALQRGEPFAPLVQRYSPERIQRKFGPDGDIGWFRMADMLEPLKQPLLTMPVGQICPEPVRTQLGYHVFRLNGRRTVPLDSLRALVAKAYETHQRTVDRERYVAELRQRYELTAHPEGLRHLQDLPPDRKEWPGEDEPLFTWKGGQLTARGYLEKHRLGKANHPASLDSAGLHKVADNLAGQQIMLAEARRLGRDRDPEIREPVESRRNELMVRELARQEGDAHPAVVSEDTVRQYYDANLDRYRTAGGTTARYELVRPSIERLLRTRARDRSMDALIDSLRAKHRDQIETHPELLAPVTVLRPAPGPPTSP